MRKQLALRGHFIERNEPSLFDVQVLALHRERASISSRSHSSRRFERSRRRARGDYFLVGFSGVRRVTTSRSLFHNRAVGAGSIARVRSIRASLSSRFQIRCHARPVRSSPSLRVEAPRRKHACLERRGSRSHRASRPTPTPCDREVLLPPRDLRPRRRATRTTLPALRIARGSDANRRRALWRSRWRVEARASSHLRPRGRRSVRRSWLRASRERRRRREPCPRLCGERCGSMIRGARR